MNSLFRSFTDQHIIFFIITCWLLLFPSCATVWEAQRVRQDVKELREYVDSLRETDLKDIKENTTRELNDLRQKQADLLVEIDRTREKITELQGEVDNLNRANEDLKKEMEALRDILNSIQEDLKKAAEKPKDEESVYKEGLGLYNAKEYDKAKESFNYLIQNFPNGKYIDNAHYWLGECYYSEGNYLAAIDEFGKVIEKFPNSPKRPSALLKAGMAFQELKRKREARAFYLRVTNEYPKSEQAGIARKKLEKLR